MNAYFLGQCASTLAALLVLAAVGGWSLWLFRAKDRPYLWLATPLAGVGILALSLTVLYHGCRLTLPWAFTVALAFNVPVTLMLVWRGGLPRCRARDWALGVALLVGVTAGGVRFVQESAIQQGEPTLVLVGGTDQFGYAHVGDWLLRHPHKVPQATPERPYESWPEAMQRDPRPGAFLLAGVAGWCRGTTTLFSFDWAVGVALVAGLLGFAAAFARRPLPLLLLLAAGALSLWYRNSRMGYFGKTLTYPGYLLLTHLFIQTWRRTTWSRLLSLVALATGFTLCLNPLALVALFGILGLGALGARLVVLVVALVRREGWPAADPGPLWKGGLLALVCLIPSFLNAPEQLHSLLSPYEPDSPPPLSYVLAEALDVSVYWGPWGCDLPGKLRPSLVKAALALAVVGFLWAMACRAMLAAGLLLCSGIVAGGLLRGHTWSLYQLQRLLYPLSLAGAVLLVQHQAVWRSCWLRLAGCLFVLALAAPRVPQFKSTFQQTMKLKPGTPGLIARSHITAVVNRVGHGTIDLCQMDTWGCLIALVELGGRDVPLQFRHPSWELTVGYRGWPAPHYAKPGRYLLTAWNDSKCLPQGTVVNPLWALVPAEGVWVGEVKPPLGLGRHPQLGHCFWIDRERAELELSNGTTASMDVEFVANTVIPLAPVDPGKLLLVWAVAGQQGKRHLTPSDKEIHIPLRLPPGDHKLSLRVEQSSVGSGGKAMQVLMSRFGLRPGLGGFERSEQR